MKRSHPVILGTLLLSLSGILCRFIGFFYRIFLSNTIGEEGMGIYQLAFSASAIFTALCCSGFQTAISRLTATANSRNQEERQILRLGLLLTMGCSAIAAFLLYWLSTPIASTLLMEERCTVLLQYYALSLPFAAIHNSINGAYLGRQKALLPAVSQLFEQIVRISSILIIWQIALSEGRNLTPADAMAGLLISEIAVVLFFIPCYFAERSRQTEQLSSQTISDRMLMKTICLLALPLIGNRLILTVLQSAETILIPGQLRVSGLSSGEALSTYGVFTGMVFPFLMFPASLTGSVATMTLPAIASAQSASNQKQILQISHNTISFSMWLGIFSAGLFRLYGKEIGFLVFGSETAGSYLQTLSFLCPFLYLTMTLSSIINGLGKPNIIFYQSIAGLILRLLSVLFLIPALGIWGYFVGIFISQSITCLLHYFYLQKQLVFSFSVRDYILHPGIYTLCAGGISLLSGFLFNRLALPSAISLVGSLSIMCLIGLLGGYRTFRRMQKS